jgi:2-dehydro-3-deoxygluconokinase
MSMSRTIEVVCFGEMLLRLSAPGKELLLQSPHLQVHFGGAEANVAVSLRKLGYRTRMVTCLPDNTLGHGAAGELRRHGVDVEPIRFAAGRMGLYFLTPGAGQRPAEVLYDRADSAFAVAAADCFDWQQLLADANWLHISGITPAVSASAAAAASRAMTAARAAGSKVSFDCNFRARVWGQRTAKAPEILRDLCQHADLIFGEDRDLQLMLGITGRSSPAAARSAEVTAAFAEFKHLRWLAHTSRTRHSVDVQELVGTLHERTTSCSSRRYALHGIVDRIGAGDAFAAGMLHGLLSELAPQKAVEFATAAACLKHSIPGDFNLLSQQDIELLLAESTPDVRR